MFFRSQRKDKCMAIVYSRKDRTFTIHTENTTYQMQVDPYGFLLHLYYGRRTRGCMEFLLNYGDRGFSGTAVFSQLQGPSGFRLKLIS